MLETICQIAIPVLGIPAILLIAKKIKWGFVLGLMSQPFWIIAVARSKQWGMLAVSIGYTISWALGIHEWFIKKEKGE